MEWQTQYLGSAAAVLSDDALAAFTASGARPNLAAEAQAAAREVKKTKKEQCSLTLSVTPEALKGEPLPGTGGAGFYQPIGKIVYANPFASGTALNKSHLFCCIASEEGTRPGHPQAKYKCHVFKCKRDEEANAIAFATEKTMSANAQRWQKIRKGIVSHEEREAAVRYWNANNPPLYHFTIGKDETISGNIRIQCKVDATLKAVSKVVHLTNLIRGNELIKLLAEKFNLTDVNPEEYAVFEIRDDSPEQDMLDDNASPIMRALSYADPSEGTFTLGKLPNGLVRINRDAQVANSARASVSTAVSTANPSASAVSMSTATTPNSVTANPAPPGTSVFNAPHASNTGGIASTNPSLNGAVKAGAKPDIHINGGIDANESTTDDELTSPLGPLLPYHEDDEDLLLDVMIARQTGNGLGFKLTPAYLLQMCIAYSSVKQGPASLERLLTKIAREINKVVTANPTNPEMLLFWASNTLKLMGSLLKDPAVFAVFAECGKPPLDEAVALALDGISKCAAKGDPPAELKGTKWTTTPELRSVIVDFYRTIDQNMSHDSLRDIVNRITAVIPSPQKGGERFDGNAGGAPMTSTPITGDRRRDPANVSSTITDADDVESDGLPPLPEEWEELIDNETKHRFFANHKTRQTSWTDPRDKLITVNLIKGGKGLGLGISGAKRTRDGRLVLGIFVSSLVPGSAADVDGTLHEGDEVLEVNGHSLIGVSREGAIDFLKQVQHGETVQLLVSQEPRRSDRSHSMRHTQL